MGSKIFQNVLSLKIVSLLKVLDGLSLLPKIKKMSVSYYASDPSFLTPPHQFFLDC